MSWQDEQFNRLFRLDPFVQQIQGMELARLMDRKERMGGMNDMDKGIYSKYIVTKADGTPLDGDCFVLRPDRDPAAVKALLAYAASTPNEELSSDIRIWLASIGADMGEPDEIAALRAENEQLKAALHRVSRMTDEQFRGWVFDYVTGRAALEGGQQ